MSSRRPDDAFCWDVPDDEGPVPLVEEPSLTAVDGADVGAANVLPPTPSDFAGVLEGRAAPAADHGWTARFTAGVLVTCLIAFGIGWRWGGEPPGVGESDRSSSTNGNAAQQEWKEHRDD